MTPASLFSHPVTSDRVICLVSYWSNESPNVCAEWTSDRIAGLISLGYKVHLVTSPTSTLQSSGNLHVHRVWSWPSYSAWLSENSGTEGSTLGIRGRSRALFAFSIGKLMDRIFVLLAGSFSNGRWFWSFPAALRIIAIVREVKPATVFATGGPSSAQFAALVASYFVNTSLVLEFQDPFIGSQFRTSRLAHRVLQSLERLFVYRSTAIVATSSGWKKELEKKYGNYESKILLFYPGSRFSRESDQISAERRENDSIRLGHLGTLYGTRNFDKVVDLVDLQSHPKITLENFGHADPEIVTAASKNDWISFHPAVSREEAFQLAVNVDGLVLLQHDDSRSDETVPFKIYDYINSQTPIFAVIRNSELEALLKRPGCFVVRHSDSHDKREMVFGEFLKAISSGDVEARTPIIANLQLAQLLGVFEARGDSSTRAADTK